MPDRLADEAQQGIVVAAAVVGADRVGQALLEHGEPGQGIRIDHPGSERVGREHLDVRAARLQLRRRRDCRLNGGVVVHVECQQARAELPGDLEH